MNCPQVGFDGGRGLRRKVTESAPEVGGGEVGGGSRCSRSWRGGQKLLVLRKYSVLLDELEQSFQLVLHLVYSGQVDLQGLGKHHLLATQVTLETCNQEIVDMVKGVFVYFYTE